LFYSDIPYYSLKKIKGLEPYRWGWEGKEMFEKKIIVLSGNHYAVNNIRKVCLFDFIVCSDFLDRN